MDPPGGVRRIKRQPHGLTDGVTATEDLFVLAHLGVPRIEAADWSLEIDGLVGRASAFGLDDLKARRKKVVEAVHHCAGNPLEPHVATRRVANVRWGGTELASLLDELEVDPRAQYLWSYGFDRGDFAGTTHELYVKDLPLRRLLAGVVLVAYELNGAPLPAEHGYPARLVVPGYYGTNSGKWLWRMHLADRRFQGPFTTTLYDDVLDKDEVASGLPPRRPVWALAPGSVIVSPAPETVVAAGETTEIWGWAWSFRGVTVAEVSVDGGTSFTRANLDPRRGWGWQRFSLPWRPAERGEDRSAPAPSMPMAPGNRASAAATRSIP